ncbi:MAG: cyanophycinase [Anaerolineae bacterium]|nr:cyanophycinase [Gemmatimonadaceae bacterium]
MRHDATTLLSVAAICLGAAACATNSPTQRSTPTTVSSNRGTLYIVGGGPQPPALVKEFVDLAGGAGRARIVIFAMASQEGLTGGEEKAQDLRALGAHATNIYVTRAQANTDSIARLLDGATGVWFGGGDQARLTAALRGTRTGDALGRLYASGAVIGGTSAGAAVMSEIMITGDERKIGGDRPPSDSSEAFLTISRENIVVDTGFSYLPGAIVDQHFVRRKRHNRLISLVLEKPVRLGVGVDESTALIVQPDGRWRIAGASVVVIYDARRSSVTPGAPLGASNVTMHVLPAGSRFDPVSGKASLP